MRRILLDFTLDESEVEARVRKQVTDLSEAEFAKWRDAGLFERQVLDGRTLYFNSYPSNLFRLCDEAPARRDPAARPCTNHPLDAPNTQRQQRDVKGTIVQV